MSRILILDDDPGIRRTLDILLRSDGHDTLLAASAEEAETLLERQCVDLALVDLQLPGRNGLEFIRRLRDRHRDVEVVIITAHGSIESAVEAMKEGSSDYLTKPFTPEQVRHRIRQLAKLRGLRTEVEELRGRLGVETTSDEPVTASPGMKHLLEVARTAAASEASVLLTGESGTGKGLLARYIHAASGRSKGPFVVLDGAGFNEHLLDSDLFGHRKGAFTGAVADKPGKIELAAGGTLFLDEVGEVPLPLQAKILRLVEDRSYERVGDPAPRMVDARLIAATNRDLEELIQDKAFRADLYYRLSVVELRVPALRHRREDFPVLLAHFPARATPRHGRKVTELEPEVEAAFENYAWPGNVRELAHVLEAAVLLCPGQTLRLDHLPPRFQAVEQSRPAEVQTLAALEEDHLRRTLAQGLSQEETARHLGIDPSTLWRKRKKYGL